MRGFSPSSLSATLSTEPSLIGKLSSGPARCKAPTISRGNNARSTLSSLWSLSQGWGSYLSVRSWNQAWRHKTGPRVGSRNLASTPPPSLECQVSTSCINKAVAIASHQGATSINCSDKETPPTRLPRTLAIGIGTAGGKMLSSVADCLATQESAALAGGVFELWAMNTDVQALRATGAPHQLQLGPGLTKGLGTGGDRLVGARAAEACTASIAHVVEGQPGVCYVICGASGGTGGGASPLVLSAAKAAGHLTVAVITLPFSFEGPRRVRQSLATLAALQGVADVVIAIDQDAFLQQQGGLSMTQAAEMAADIAMRATLGITRLLQAEAVDGAPRLRSLHGVLPAGGTLQLLRGSGRAVIGHGTGPTPRSAVHAALATPGVGSLHMFARNLVCVLSSPTPLGPGHVQAALTSIEAERGAPSPIIVVVQEEIQATAAAAVGATIILTGLPHESADVVAPCEPVERTALPSPPKDTTPVVLKPAAFRPQQTSRQPSLGNQTAERQSGTYGKPVVESSRGPSRVTNSPSMKVDNGSAVTMDTTPLPATVNGRQRAGEQTSGQLPGVQMGTTSSQGQAARAAGGSVDPSLSRGAPPVKRSQADGNNLHTPNTEFPRRSSLDHIEVAGAPLQTSTRAGAKNGEPGEGAQPPQDGPSQRAEAGPEMGSPAQVPKRKPGQTTGGSKAGAVETGEQPVGSSSRQSAGLGHSQGRQGGALYANLEDSQGSGRGNGREPALGEPETNRRKGGPSPTQAQSASARRMLDPRGEGVQAQLERAKVANAAALQWWREVVEAQADTTQQARGDSDQEEEGDPALPGPAGPADSISARARGILTRERCQEQYRLVLVTQQLADGSRYEGQIAGAGPHGHGRCEFSNGDVYEGGWQHGERHGWGRLAEQSGDVYEGTWRRGHRHGQGRIVYSTGHILTARFVDGHVHGPAIIAFDHGTTFYGAFRFNRRHGVAVSIDASGNREWEVWDHGQQIS